MGSGRRFNQGTGLPRWGPGAVPVPVWTRFAMKHVGDTGRETPKMTSRFRTAARTDEAGASRAPPSRPSGGRLPLEVSSNQPAVCWTSDHWQGDRRPL